MSDAAAFGPDRPARDPFFGIERVWPREDALDRAAQAALAAAQARLAPLRRQALRRILPAVEQQAEGLAALDDAGLLAAARAAATAARRADPAALEPLARAFALVREAAGRRLGLRHRPVQLLGGHAMARGWLAEMATGEGKTLTATLPAAAMALSGRPVHVVTVNDYLAGRDAALMGPVYAALGLSVGVAVEGMDIDARRAAYAADITYCSNKTLAFDFLRDRLTLGRDGAGRLSRRLGALHGRAGEGPPTLLRGLAFALVDEADSVLIDEARTPLILSGEGPALFDAALLGAAQALAGALERGRDWRIEATERRILLTREGRQSLEAAATLGDPRLRNRTLREELAVKALSAQHLFERDVHYLVRDGRVVIVDEYTGRTMPDRFWTEGLHQLVELKEGLEPSRGRVTLARTTYQRFFRRYDRLAGMTGTAREVAAEIWRVYRLPIAPIPTHRPVRRVVQPARVFGTEAAKWAAVAAEAARLSASGVPVLIGARSVAASAAVSAALAGAGVAHEMLSAAQDAEEARKIAEAGRPGQVTVATNMAGRGADIPLGPGVAARGGLHVLMTERHDSARVDRQLAGRAARQGEPGVFVAMLSRQDALLADYGSVLARTLARWPGQAAARLALGLAQARAERVHARMRHDLLRQDEVLNDAMAFAGAPE